MYNAKNANGNLKHRIQNKFVQYQFNFNYYKNWNPGNNLKLGP